MLRDMTLKMAVQKRFTEYEAARMMRSILSTVALCHDHYIVHSDLKPENFIFSHDGPGMKLKSIDFGISQFCPFGKKLHDLVREIASCGISRLKSVVGWNGELHGT